MEDIYAAISGLHRRLDAVEYHIGDSGSDADVDGSKSEQTISDALLDVRMNIGKELNEIASSFRKAQKFVNDADRAVADKALLMTSADRVHELGKQLQIVNSLREDVEGFSRPVSSELVSKLSRLEGELSSHIRTSGECREQTSMLLDSMEKVMRKLSEQFLLWEETLRSRRRND